MRIVAATKNLGKRDEFAILLKEVGWEAEFIDDIPEAAQNASTFIGNAASKASTAAKHTGKLCIADDTGLVIADLPGGGPGIRASKMAEKHGGWREAMEAIVKDAGLLDDPRALVKAHFVCGMSVSHPDGSTWSREAFLEAVRYLFQWDKVFQLEEEPGASVIIDELRQDAEAFDRYWTIRKLDVEGRLFDLGEDFAEGDDDPRLPLPSTPRARRYINSLLRAPKKV